MQSLLDPSGDYLQTEKKVKKYLKSIPDEQIKIFYENVELTPFPILIVKEYLKRFSKKYKKSTKTSRKQSPYYTPRKRAAKSKKRK